MLPVLKAGLPILCEKPLTPDAQSSLNIVKAEIAGNKKLIQLGFMRRFDNGYQELRELIVNKKQGELLGLHCAHRNPSVPDTYYNDMLIFDSVVHEIDVVRFLTDSPIHSVQVRQMKRNSLSPEKLNEPILALLQTESGVLATVEMNVSVQFGYQVKTEAVFEKGVAEIGRTSGMTRFFDSSISTPEHTSFKTRFAQAFESEIQLSGWSHPRRVIVLRRQLSKSLMSAEEVPGMKQLSLDFAEIDTSKKRFYEFAVLVTSLEDEVVTIAQHYRDRADSENIFDELKNQWSWGGFTTQDLKRCRLMARNTALIYNWWTIFVRLAKPGKHLEAISSRPLLLHAIGKQVNHGGQTFIKITSTHGRLSKRQFTNEVQFYS